jgi:lipid II:glycine glycyltransferase (peptidoglycan interpeptide bridge formation enzyme)
LNHAERKELELRCGTGADLMNIFVNLYGEMWEEKRFATGVDIHQMRDLHRALPANEQFMVQIAMSDGVPAAGHVSFVLGDTCVYLLGASNELGRKLKASYLLQWKTIELAKGRGAQWYDLGGVDSESNPGVYHFKSGMGGREVQYLPPMVAPGRSRSRHLVPLAERAYRILRRYRRAG